MKQYVLWLLISTSLSLYSQTERDTTSINPRYFEDQFYAGITYNFILDKPDEVDQRNFSYGLQAGFIKDIPLNVDRTIGLGAGFGLAIYSYYTNIQAIENGNEISYQLVVNEPDFRRSKLESYLLEVPLEVRWRNSNAVSYNFWRIYAGVKLGYAFNSRSKFVLQDTKESFKNTDARSFQYGLTLNFGYHNFNIHTYYSLIELFNDDVTLDGSPLQIRPLRIGLIFYIL